MMVFMPVVVVLLGQFCREVIGRQDLKGAAIGRLLYYTSNILSYPLPSLSPLPPSWTNIRVYQISHYN